MGRMKRWEVRHNCEYVLVVEAETEVEALTRAATTEKEEWDCSWSPIEAEEVEGEGPE